MSPHPKFGFSCFTAQRLVRPAKGRPGACHAGHWPHVFEEARRLTKSSSARRRGLRFGLGGTRASYSKPRIPAWGGSDERGLRERRGLYRGTPPIRSGRPRVRPGDPPAREPDQYRGGNSLDRKSLRCIPTSSKHCSRRPRIIHRWFKTLYTTLLQDLYPYDKFSRDNAARNEMRCISVPVVVPPIIGNVGLPHSGTPKLLISRSG